MANKPEMTLEQALVEIKRLSEENASLKKTEEIEAAVKEKMADGLTRQQAETVVKQQAEHDAWLKQTEAAQKKK
jgi:hypothetical protein